jgi:predicted transcriptional regulator
MLGLFSVSFGAYSTTPSNEFFICDTICPSVAYSFSHTDKKIVADLANYQLNFSNTVLNLLRETDLYKKMKKEYKQDPQLSKPSWIGSDDPVLWDPNFNILKQSAKLTVEQVAKKIGITNQDSIDHIKNINLLTMYYNSLGGPYGGRDYVYARSLTTGAVKSLDRYKKTYDNTTVYIDNSHYRKKQPIFIYK